mgnify:CR=1 FL=1
MRAAFPELRGQAANKRMLHTVRCDNIAFCRIADASRAEGVAARARAGFTCCAKSEESEQRHEYMVNETERRWPVATK